MRKKVEDFILYLREDTYDMGIFKEPDYERCNYNQNDIWLDAGGNIGIFGLKYHDKVKMIVSYEPEPENYNIMVAHYTANNCDNVKYVQKAIVENDDKVRTFYLNRKTNKGLHSFYVQRGRDEIHVECENFNNVVDRWNINKIKMDVEGGEFDLFLNFDRWDKIEEIIFEWHIKHLKDYENNKWNILRNLLISKGYDLYHKDFNGNWQVIVHAVKNKV